MKVLKKAERKLFDLKNVENFDILTSNGTCNTNGCKCGC